MFDEALLQEVECKNCGAEPDFYGIYCEACAEGVRGQVERYTDHCCQVRRSIREESGIRWIPGQGFRKTR